MEKYIKDKIWIKEKYNLDVEFEFEDFFATVGKIVQKYS